MQWIADNLFVGNKLSSGREFARRGASASICATSNRQSSCSAPGVMTSLRLSRRSTTILDLYDDVDEIVAGGQTIVYSLHPTIGHLGIFVSGKVAAKEHNEFVSCMEMIEATPPGLYEAVITDAGPDTANRNLVDGKHLFRLEKAHAQRHPRAWRQ